MLPPPFKLRPCTATGRGWAPTSPVTVEMQFSFTLAAAAGATELLRGCKVRLRPAILSDEALVVDYALCPHTMIVAVRRRPLLSLEGI